MGVRTNREVSDECTGDQIGVAGPSMVGGALQVMYQVALALFIGLAPLFILCLLFKRTASLFQRWLLYGIGTMFAQAVTAFMAVMVKKIVVAVAVTFAARYALAAATPNVNPMSVSSMAMMQGGIGMLLTMALVTVPPMAASFFQGTLGSYMAYSVFGGNAGAGQRPGESGYRGEGVNRDTSDGVARNRSAAPAPAQMVSAYGIDQQVNHQAIPHRSQR